MYLFVSAFEDEEATISPNDSYLIEPRKQESDLSIMPAVNPENQAVAQVKLDIELEQMETSRIRSFQQNYDNRMHFSSCDPKAHPDGFYIRVLAPSIPDLDRKYVTSHVILSFFYLTNECSMLIWKS
jgi:hypothetical protein